MRIASFRRSGERRIFRKHAYGRARPDYKDSRPAASNRIKIHGATRVHAKHLATEEEKLPKTATGTVGSFSLKSGPVAPRRAASGCAFPLVRFLLSPKITEWSRSYESRWEPAKFTSLLHRQRELFCEAVQSSRCNLGLRSHAAEVHFSVIAAAQPRACNAARHKDYERCNIAGTTAKRRGGPQRCRACARRLLYCCSSPH